MFLLARQPAAPSELQIFGWTGYKHDAPTAFEAFSPPRATYIQRPHERSADESRQTPALLSPRTTTMMSRPARDPLLIKQWPAASV